MMKSDTYSNYDSTMEIKIVQSQADIKKCWSVFSLLRPHLVEDVFIDTVTEMITEGYQIAYIEKEDEVVSAIGFRYLQMLYNGKQIYIDDLTTSDKVRGEGYGTALLDYVIDLAKTKNYDCVTLDSGPTRHTAHRLYLNKGFDISSYHFMNKL